MAQALRKLGSSEAAARCCQAGQVFMDLHAPTEMGWPAPKIKDDSSGFFCWLQAWELTTVMPEGSTLWISFLLPEGVFHLPALFQELL